MFRSIIRKLFGIAPARDTADDFIQSIERVLQRIQSDGGELRIAYKLKDGKVLTFVFDGAPFKGKPLQVIDLALAWEVSEFAKANGL